MTDLYDNISQALLDNLGLDAITPQGLYEFVTPKFIFKGSNDCCTFYLDDVTDYTVIDQQVGTLAITSALFYKDCCGLLCLCPASPFTKSGRKEYANKRGDGTYVVIVTMSWTYEVEGQEIVVSDQIEVDLTLDCCKDLREDIICTARTKMIGLLCEINTRRKVGRDWCKLMWSLYELSNVRWLMLESCIDCEDTQFFKCYIDKIKSYDCGMC